MNKLPSPIELAENSLYFFDEILGSEAPKTLDEILSVSGLFKEIADFRKENPDLTPTIDLDFAGIDLRAA